MHPEFVMGDEAGKPPAGPALPGGKSDRRQGERYPMDAGLVAHPAHNRNRVIRGRVVDLSRAGISAVMAADLEPGEVLEVQFGLPYAARPVQMKAAICNREGYRYGLEFVHVIASQQEMINRTCATLALLR
jgi:c-di-GMP-binding flagellar brake protein YcgR